MAFKDKLNQFNAKINSFTKFVIFKIRNYRNLSIGEQISYPAIGLGIVLILTSFVMFLF